MISKISIITTADGSHSLKNEELNETYHSFHGALQESNYVFIKNGLGFWFGSRRSGCRVLEIGFGTGLNALLALEFAENRHEKLYFETIETHPVPAEIYTKLNYPVLLGNSEMTAFFNRLHTSPWGTREDIGEFFSFKKVHCSVHDYSSPEPFDVIFFDAFAPNKQAGMWTAAVMDKMYGLLSPGGILVTYCAQGQFKRNLREAGFQLETLPGPPGKKEMVRATKSL